MSEKDVHLFLFGSDSFPFIVVKSLKKGYFSASVNSLTEISL
jgi:hypothetical protein